MIMNIILLWIWFFLLAKWADYFVDWAWWLAKKFKLPELLIWLVIVAFGTSLPELFVNIESSLAWAWDLAIWNVLGSNISNIGLILAIAMVSWSVYVKKSINTNIYISILFSAVLLVLAWLGTKFWQVEFSRAWWFFLLIMFLTYMIYSFRQKEDIDIDDIKYHKKTIVLFWVLVWWLLAIIWGWKLVIENAIALAKIFWMSEKLIGLTIVAVWTSLPELIVTLSSIKKWKTAMWIWNIVWSNIFNIGFILAVSILISPIKTNTNIFLDISVATILALTVGFIVSISSTRIKKIYGLVLLAIYLVYNIYIVFFR